MQVITEFRHRFRLDELTFHEGDNWISSVRPEQITLGSMVVSLRRGALRFEELTPDEGGELAAILGMVERIAIQRLSAVRINVIALMMVDPVVHFHVLPRYDRVVQYGGRSWADQDWPGPPVFRSAPVPDDMLESLRDDLRHETL